MKTWFSVLTGICLPVLVMAGGSDEQKDELRESASREAAYPTSVYKAETEWLFGNEKPMYGGVLRIPMSTGPQSFNFYGTLDSSAYQILYNILSPIVEINPVTNEIEPGLAESWKISPDGKSIVFSLREVQWSDGEPLTADDVIFTFENFVLNKFAEGNSIARYTLGGEVVRLNKIDRMTFEAVLPETYGPFFLVLSAVLVYLEHKLADKIDPDDPGSVNGIWTTDTEPGDILSTGPFMLADYVVDQKVALEVNPYFWKVDPDGRLLPYVDALEYLILPNEETHSLKLSAGEIDYIGNLDPGSFTSMKQQELNEGNIVVYAAEPTKTTPSPLHIGFNFDNSNPELAELFSNVMFRRAMEHAVNRDRIIEEVYNTLAVYGGVPVLPANTAFYNPEIEAIRRSYNLERAGDMLAELGLADRDGDGMLEFPSGNPFEFIITTQVDTLQADAALIFSEDLKKLGIKADLQLLDGSARSQKVFSGDFDVSLWAFGNQPDPQLRKAIWQPGNPLYYVHYSVMDAEERSPRPDKMSGWELEVYELFERGQVTMDPLERKDIYGRWQRIYAEQVPFIFIAKGMDVAAAGARVGNFLQLDNGMVAYQNHTVFMK